MKLARDPLLLGVGLLVGIGLLLMLVQLVILALASAKEGLLLDATPFGLANFRLIFQDARFGDAVQNTLVLAAGTVVVMLSFVTPLLWLYTRTDLPGKSAMLTLLTAKVAIPGFLVALAYIILFNPSNGLANTLARDVFGVTSPPFNIYSMYWIVFFQGTSLVTPAFFMLMPAFRGIDAGLEEAAFVSGVRKRVVATRIVLSLALPAVVATAIFYFIVALESFDFPGMIGLPARILVMSTFLFRLVQPADESPPRYGEAAVVGILTAVVVAVLTVAYLWSIRRAERYEVIAGKRGQQGATHLSSAAKAFAWGFIGLYLTIELLIPLLMLVWSSLLPFIQGPSLKALKSMSLKSYVAAFHELPPVLLNTGIVMVAVPTLVVSISVCTSWVITRTRLRGRRSLEFLIMATIAVPSIVGALAFLYLGLSLYKLVPIYTTIWIIVIALAPRSITWANRSISGTMIQIHRELEEACSISGVSRGRAFASVVVPTVMPALLFCWVWVALLSVRDLTEPLMLARPDTQVFATLIWGFNGSGNTSLASALGVILLVLIAGLVIVFQRATRRAMA